MVDESLTLPDPDHGGDEDPDGDQQAPKKGFRKAIRRLLRHFDIECAAGPAPDAGAGDAGLDASMPDAAMPDAAMPDAANSDAARDLSPGN